MSLNIHTFKKVVAGKFALLMMFFLAQAVSAMAGTKLYMEDFNIKAGETKEVALILDNDKAATALEVHIDLPAGLDYVDGSVSKTARVKGRGADAQASTATDQLVILLTDATIAPGSGEVLTFQVENNGLAEGNYPISLSDIVVSDANGDQINIGIGEDTYEDTYEATVSVLGLGECSFSGPENITVFVGEEYQVDIALSNEGVVNLAAIQGKLTLPKGLELVPDEEDEAEMFIYSDRIPAKAQFKFQKYEGYTTFVLSSSTNALITGEEGVIFSFKVKATKDLAENSEILLSDLFVGAATGQSAACNFIKDVENGIKISVYNATPLTDAKQALTDEIAAATTLLGEADQTVEPALTFIAAIADAQAVLESAESTTEQVKTAVETLKAAEVVYVEAAAVVAANEELAAEKLAAEALKISDEAKAYETENVKTAVATAEQAIADANTAIAAVEAKIAEGKLSTDNKEALEAAIAAAKKAIEDAQTAIAAAEQVYTDQKAADDAEAAALTTANEKLAAEKLAAEALKVSDEAKAYETENVKTAVADAEQAIADANTAIGAVEAKIAEGKLATDNKEALETAIAAADQAIEDAKTAIAAAEKVYTDQKAADDAEADALKAANEKVAAEKLAAEALKVSEEAKAYEAENVKKAVADAETAIADANTAIAAVETVIAKGELATTNKEDLETAIAAADQAIEDAKTAIAAAEKVYGDQKTLDDAAEAGAKASAEASVTTLKVSMEDLAVSEDAKAYEAENVKKAVADAEEAITAANAAIKDVEDLIAEGKLATDNKEAVARAILAAQKAVNAAAQAVETAENLYTEQKATDEEAAALKAANEKFAAVKAANDSLKVSAEATAYENETVQGAVATALQAITDANTAVAAVEAKIAEGKLATDNKEALATAIATAEQAIADAKTAIATAEKTYTDQKALDDEAAAVLAALEQLGTRLNAADSLKVSDEAKAYEDETVQGAVATAEQAIADAKTKTDAVAAVIAKGELATTNKEELEASLAAADKAIADAKTAIATAEEVYANVKAGDDEAAALKLANEKLAAEKTAADSLKVSAEAKAYEAENVKTAVATAEQAIADANTAIAAVETVIAKGELATTNKEDLETAIAAADKAIADAKTAIATAEEVYANVKAGDDEAAALKLANEKLAAEKTAADSLKVSAEAKAYEAENVKTAVATAEQAIADANTAVAAVDSIITEGNLSTENKEALAAAIAAADKAIEDAQTAIAAAEKAYTDQKAADEAAALADAKEALQGDITAAKALNVVGMTAESVQALNDAIAAAEAALAAEEATVESLGKAKSDLEAAVAGLMVDYYAFDGVAYVVDAETGKLMAAGHDWGTRGIVNEVGLDLTFATDAETKMVTIDSRVVNKADHFLGSNLYMDAAAAKWGLLKQENGFYITDGIQYVSIDADDNLVLSNDPRLWLIVTAEEMKAIMEKATAENPVDATWMIQGANFSRNDARNSAWTVSEDCTNKNLCGGNDTNKCAESWHSTFTISQTIEGVPNGLYQLTAQGFWRQDGENEEVPVFFINDQTAEFPVKEGTENSMNDASVSFTEGKYTIEPIQVVVTDGVITLGVKNETNTTIWCIWDNFRLSYLGAYDPTIYIDTDLTAQFPTDYQGWTGATGLVGWAAPKVQTNDGREVAACERYEGTCANTGDVFTRTLTGLANGTYRIELYGAAAYTAGRGFESELVEGDETAVYLYAETAPAAGTRRAGGEVVKQYIPAHVATDFNGTGIASVVLDNVVVTDGTVKLGMYKEKPYTNWHVVQIKGVTAKVDAIELHTAALAAAQAAMVSEDYLAVTGKERADLETAITNNTTVAEETAEAYEAAVNALGEATTAFTAAKAAYEDYAAAQVYLVDLPYAKAEKKPVAEVATSAADATAKAEALIPALRAYYESNAALENVEGAVDMTSKIINPAAEDALDGEVWKTVLGEGSGGSIDIKNGEPWTDAAGVAEHRYFDGGDWGQTAWDVTLQQDVTLPAGKYMLTAKMRAAADVEQTLFAGENSIIGLSISAAGGVFNRGWNDASIEFELPEEATIAIGVRGKTEKQYNWMSFSDFRLVQFPAEVEPTEKYVVDKKFTSVDDLDGQMFAIVIETEHKAFYNKDAQNLAYDTYTDAMEGKAYLWKIHSLANEGDDKLQNAYAIESVNADGSSQSLWGHSPLYLNSGAEGGFNGCFVLGNGTQYGTDVQYGGAWEIEYVAGKGFTLKNVARGGYFVGVNPAPAGSEPIYLTFCTLKENQGEVNPELPEGVIYSWESADGTPVEMGGTIAYVNGDGDRLNYKNGDYYTICLNGKKGNLNDETASANAGHMVITLDEAVAAGDTIAYTAFINKNETKKASAYIVFETGTTAEGEIFSDEANIDPTFNGVPTLKYTIVPEDAAGSKTITLTRSQTGTNLFITKLQVIKASTTTGISVVKAAIEDGAVYNLNGQKVNTAKKGLYIINGKKVVIK